LSFEGERAYEDLVIAADDGLERLQMAANAAVNRAVSQCFRDE
jgi:hypothetical protein